MNFLDKNSDSFLLQYLTFWGVLISYLFVFSPLVFKNVPLWVFLSGCCILTSITIVGTFFISIVQIVDKTPKERASIISTDAVYHSLPLILLILVFTIMVKKVKKPSREIFFRKNFQGRKCEPIESNFFILSLIPALIFAILYTSFAEPRDSYKTRKTDNLIIIVLIFATFCSSYQIYFNWSKHILGF